MTIDGNIKAKIKYLHSLIYMDIEVRTTYQAKGIQYGLSINNKVILSIGTKGDLLRNINAEIVRSGGDLNHD